MAFASARRLPTRTSRASASADVMRPASYTASRVGSNDPGARSSPSIEHRIGVRGVWIVGRCVVVSRSLWLEHEMGMPQAPARVDERQGRQHHAADDAGSYPGPVGHARRAPCAAAIVSTIITSAGT